MVYNQTGDFRFEDNENGTITVTHQPSGSSFTFDSSDGSFSSPKVQTGLVDTDQTQVGDDAVLDARDYTTNGEVTLDAGSYSGTEDLAQALAEHPRHLITLNIPNGGIGYDILIPPMQGGHQRANGTASESGGLINITGDPANISNHPVPSVYAEGTYGKLGVLLQGVELQADNPYDNEKVPVAFYSSQGILRDVNFAGGTNGVLSYGGSKVELSSVDFGSNVLTGDAVRVKHGATVYEQKAVSTPTSGNVGGYAYDPQIGTIWRSGGSSLSGDSGEVHRGPLRWGFVIWGERNAFQNMAEFRQQLKTAGGINLLAQPLTGVKQYSNAAETDLDTRELAIDTNRGGTGAAAVVYRDASGNGYYVDMSAL